MNDLSDALNCIEEMKRCGTYGGQKIGRVVEEFTGQVSSYREGNIVLYTPEVGLDSERELAGLGQGPTGRVTVETPLTPEQIFGDLGRGLIRTIGTMIGVPQKYVEEIGV